jgi:enamine deaminase RidA (YjgF/YER057c/UK114 family)
MSQPQSSRDERFAALGLELAPRPGPEAVVRPVSRVGDLLVLSGQVAFAGTRLVATGRLGDDVDIPLAQQCARQCAANLLGRTLEELGSLDLVHQVVKVTVYVASAPGFREQHIVADGASDLFVEVLGDDGRHARAALGVAELPLGTPVEVEAWISVGTPR